MPTIIMNKFLSRTINIGIPTDCFMIVLIISVNRLYLIEWNGIELNCTEWNGSGSKIIISEVTLQSSSGLNEKKCRLIEKKVWIILLIPTT